MSIRELEEAAVREALQKVFAWVDYDLYKSLDDPEAYGEDDDINFDDVTTRFIDAYNAAILGRLQPPR